MSTWHQRQNSVKLYHDTMWTVVEDPPNDCRTLTLFETEATARVYLDRVKAKGKRAYILRPANLNRAETAL